MALHLIRMIPFRHAISENQALFALASSIKEMTGAFDMIRDLNQSELLIIHHIHSR